MKQKKIFDKVMKIFAVMVFILSMCFSQKYANNVEAWDNSTPHEFTRIKQIYFHQDLNSMNLLFVSLLHHL